MPKTTPKEDKTKTLAEWIVPKIEILPLSESKPAKWNPRMISERAFQTLIKSIQEDPQFMTLRPILRTKKGTIYAGNMRYRALSELGYEKGPFITTDIPEDEAKKRSLRDNNHFGEYQMEELAELSNDLKLDPIEMELLALPQNLIRALSGPSTGGEGGEVDTKAMTTATEHECPKCGFKF